MAEDLDSLVGEKRHKELVSLLTRILSKSDADPELKSVIEKLNTQINHFASAISKIEIKAPAAPAPNVQVVNKNEEVIKLASEIKNNLDELKKIVSKDEVKKEWKFIIKRDSNNYISEVIAKQV